MCLPYVSIFAKNIWEQINEYLLKNIHFFKWSSQNLIVPLYTPCLRPFALSVPVLNIPFPDVSPNLQVLCSNYIFSMKLNMSILLKTAAHLVYPTTLVFPISLTLLCFSHSIYHLITYRSYYIFCLLNAMYTRRRIGAGSGHWWISNTRNPDGTQKLLNRCLFKELNGRIKMLF